MDDKKFLKAQSNFKKRMKKLRSRQTDIIKVFISKIDKKSIENLRKKILKS
ncbi:MAG: hypothetical protein ABII02_02850 [Candidatus Magasanikbacteria bacterium]